MIEQTDKYQKNILVVLRGGCGSGKTHLAQELLTYYGKEVCSHHEVDEFCITEERGGFRDEKLPEAYKNCEKAIEMDMKNERQVICVANTFQTIDFYLDSFENLANRHGYDFIIFDIYAGIINNAFMYYEPRNEKEENEIISDIKDALFERCPRRFPRTFWNYTYQFFPKIQNSNLFSF